MSRRWLLGLKTNWWQIFNRSVVGEGEHYRTFGLKSSGQENTDWRFSPLFTGCLWTYMIQSLFQSLKRRLFAWNLHNNSIISWNDKEIVHLWFLVYIGRTRCTISSNFVWFLRWSIWSMISDLHVACKIFMHWFRCRLYRRKSVVKTSCSGNVWSICVLWTHTFALDQQEYHCHVSKTKLMGILCSQTSWRMTHLITL
jgi:hypothetical protein